LDLPEEPEPLEHISDTFGVDPLWIDPFHLITENMYLGNQMGEAEKVFASLIADIMHYWKMRGPKWDLKYLKPLVPVVK